MELGLFFLLCFGVVGLAVAGAIVAAVREAAAKRQVGGPAAPSPTERAARTAALAEKLGVQRPVRLVPCPAGAPQPRERWWVDVPHEDDPSASKKRPCLVLGFSGRGYWVLKCTTREPKNAEWRVPVNRAWWKPAADKDSFVDLQPYHLPRAFLQRRQGVLGGEKLYREITGRVRWDRAWDFIG